MDDGELGRRRVEIIDAAGGGVPVLLAHTNLSWKPISKRPIVYDSYGIPLGITTGTFQLVPTWQTFNLRLQTKVLTAYFTRITFHTHHFSHPHAASRKHDTHSGPGAYSYSIVILLLCLPNPRTDTASSKFKDQEKLIPPLPLQIFASDAEVVLPQALTASQLFGIERVTGIELEAAAGTIGLSQLFLRWLALMPEGDHMNVIDPPGLTVMRISGGRYRVTGAHRVVWRWMNKFSPASMFTIPSDFKPAKTSGMEEDDAPDTDFDFGDLVSMTIIDVFETDADGKLLSYCPTFDNRAVHKTQEVTERLRKGASHFKERMEVVARSPAGKSVNKTAGNFGRMSISAALAVGNIVKNKIEEGIHKHQHPKQGGGGLGRENDISEEASYTDAVGGDDVEEEALLRGDEHSTATPGGGGASKSAASKGEGYFSDESTPSR